VILDKVIDRGERLEVLADKSDNLRVNSIKFKNEAKALKRQMCCQNYKFLIILVFVLLALAFVIATWACGGFTYEKCKP
jgi:flagellar biosynthesis/type III secretory pathway M-ring protein FliF/YscJ